VIPRKRPDSGQIDRCLCGSGLSGDACCDPLLSGERPAETAEALMRSRYCAFVGCNQSYLLASWHPDTRPGHLDFDPQQRWLGLKILRTGAGAAADDEGIVEFVARYKIDGRGYRLHEISRFVRTEEGWRYLDGTRGATDSNNRT